MRLLAAFLLLIPLAAQEVAKPAPDAEKPALDAAKPAPDAAKPADQAAPAPAPPEPSGDNWLQGSIEVGYRFDPDVMGISTPIAAWSISAKAPSCWMRISPCSIPPKFCSTARMSMPLPGEAILTTPFAWISQKDKLYRSMADYRNIEYFNFLPSYADPTLNQGVLLNQNSYDTAIRTLHIQLDLLPGKWITPYLGFERNTQFGSGVTVFHTDQNDFPVASLYSDQTNTYHAGVRIELGAITSALRRAAPPLKTTRAPPTTSRIQATSPDCSLASRSH